VKSLALLGAAACFISLAAPVAAASNAQPAYSGTQVSQTLPNGVAPALDWGDVKVEYYTDGVVIGYAKGESMGMRILGSNTCFSGDWVGTGHWLGYYYSAGGKSGSDGDVTWVKGKKLIVKLPAIPIDTTYYRTTSKKAAKVWGSTARAKKALRRCWSPPS
jgi:hypothetical protein